MKAILVINAGSSSIKFTLYEQKGCKLIYKGLINNLLGSPVFKVENNKLESVVEKNLADTDHTSILKVLVNWIKDNGQDIEVTAIGHRIVHGGRIYSQPVIITKEIIKELESLIPLAPLHQPYNLGAIKIMLSSFPTAKQVACFDTAFHTTNAPLTQYYAIPRKYTEGGVVRYGFHGLSYEYISSILPNVVGERANGKVIIAHLGNGSSMCAVHNRKSVATTMGFTALEGLMMGTRPGSIDPGIILYLQQHYKLSITEVEHILYKESGLLGVSGISHDIEVLSASKSSKAKEAIELFCYRAAQELAKLCASLQGLDILVFTAGIGENSARIRQKICLLSAWLGIKINDEANNNNTSCISMPESPIGVYVIPTDEEWMIARHTLGLSGHL